MTTDEYISRTKELLPVHPGRYTNIIETTFHELTKADFFVKENLNINFRIISSASFFTEVVYTNPRISLIWDNYQFELIEKFILSGVAALNNQQKTADLIFKTNINAALSIRLTNISPELSYVFAKHYREQLNALNCDSIILIRNHQYDLLYVQLLFLGHELAHIITEHKKGKVLFEGYKESFKNLMDSLVRIYGKMMQYEGARSYSELYSLLMQDSNADYQKELICDIISYGLLHKTIESLNGIMTPTRKYEELYDDLFEMHKFVLMTLDTFRYIMEYWTRIGLKSGFTRKITGDNINLQSDNYKIWNTQFEARETFLFLYMRLNLFQERKIFIPSNKQITKSTKSFRFIFRWIFGF